MEYEVEEIKIGNNSLARVILQNVSISEAGQALELLMNIRYQGYDDLLLNKEDLDPAFYDLKTGLAGEVLQKFSNYRSRLAILGNFDQTESKALRDFIYESNKLGRILFVSSMDELISKWYGD